MGYSFSSLLTTMIFGNVLIAFIWLFTKGGRGIKHIGIGTFVFLVTIVAMRLMCPFALQIAKDVACPVVLPQISMFLDTPFLLFGNAVLCVSHVLCAIWLTGAIIAFCRILFIYWLFTQMVRNLPSIADNHAYGILQKAQGNYNLPVDFKIKWVSGLTAPLIFGQKSPVILLPDIDISNDELLHIFSHEIAHYYNFDFYFKTLVEGLCCLYCWNPLVLLLKRQMQLGLEIRADFTATKHMGEMAKLQYLESLIKMAKNQRKLCSIATEFSGNTSLLQQRIHAIMDCEETKSASCRKRKTIFIIVIVMMLSIINLSFSVILEPYSISPEDGANTVELTEERTYLVINQDGGYDIYFNNEYFGTFTDIPDSLLGVQVWEN